jgi:UDPglucose 6-dehydrogenase
MKISVVGSGYVGLVAGACFADLGHDVIVVDNDQEKLAALNRGEVPIHENFLPELLDRHRGHRLTFTDDLQGAVKASAAIFVAVGTPPTERGEADLSYVESVASGIAGAIDSYKIVVEKSTVPVYTSDWIRKIVKNVVLPSCVRSMRPWWREHTICTPTQSPALTARRFLPR